METPPTLSSHQSKLTMSMLFLLYTNAELIYLNILTATLANILMTPTASGHSRYLFIYLFMLFDKTKHVLPYQNVAGGLIQTKIKYLDIEYQDDCSANDYLYMTKVQTYKKVKVIINYKNCPLNDW